VIKCRRGLGFAAKASHEPLVTGQVR